MFVTVFFVCRNAAAAQAAASVAAMGSAQPVWQLKVHSNDPRDLAAAAAAASASQGTLAGVWNNCPASTNALVFLSSDPSVCRSHV